jgi:hypothetical protein
MNDIKTLEIIYSNTTNSLNLSKKLLSFQYDEITTVKDLKSFISNQYKINYKKIFFSNNRETLDDDSCLLDKIFITRLSKIGNDSIKSLKVRVVPQVNLNEIIIKFNFLPIHSINDSDENNFTIKYDLILNGSKIEDFKKNVIDYFSSKLKELNYFLDDNFGVEFFECPSSEVAIFTNNQEDLSEIFDFMEKDYFTCYFLVRDSSMIFFLNKNTDEQVQIDIKNKALNENKDFRSLRISPLQGQNFFIILQTYNNSFKELEVNSEMTLNELKNMIELILGIQKNYQELFYLVYKLTDENKKLKNYYIRPNGVLFLRGFFFPIVFTDFYEKSSSCMLGINIAENVKCIKQELVKKLNLQFTDFSLIFNGKELNDSRYLIDYNIQKMQTIYIK